MKVIILFFLITIIFTQQDFTITYDEWKTCSDEEYNRVDVFSVQGKVFAELKSQVGVIEMGVETLNLNAAQAWTESRMLIDNSIQAIKNILLDSSLTEFTTSGISIQPETQRTYNYELNQYNPEIFLGYRIKIILTIKTKELNFIGNIIDAGISNGMNTINSVDFLIEPQEKQKIKDSLIEAAIQDSRNRAEIVMKTLGYEIIGIKDMQIDVKEPIPYSYAFGNGSQAMRIEDSAPTQVFTSKQIIDSTATVTYMIKKSI